MINKIILITLTTIISVSTLFSEVNFNLVFTDPKGTGLNAPENAWMIEESQKAANLVGKLIKQNARVNIRINATTETPYAWAPAEYYKMIKEDQGIKVILNAQDKILSEKTTPDSQWDGHIEFNIQQFSKDRNDEFRRTFVHELTHTLGFLNFQSPTSKEISYYNDYDTLLYDANGNPFLINNGKSKNNLRTNPQFNPSTELYACGDCIRKHNNGKCVKIYNPKICEIGSSFAHLDKQAHPRSIMADRKSHNEYKIWNNYELGIIQDLGYEIDWNKYYETIKNIYPATVAINIDMKELDTNNAQFEVILNKDFPKECFETKISKDTHNKTLSIKMNKESKLVLIDKNTKDHLYTLDLQKGNDANRLHLGKEIYEIHSDKNEQNRETKINIKLNKITANS